ncbi:NADH:flavin oxidoreductase/NADH oxidase [Galbitalea soli]|uniref:NADH:flavin oxidoreductase/NADH oxidase n=1 Tax=Galbitalea soli TaxID=1268042 RepID=A0A7C9PLV7_9MICO|nr:NADH:flavin oxidoreductase/NADH oxidase [Galbitalea soli]NYJ31225.1 2,4-dienoyl-CoA reductase-like NADH-dependent reductase (Old Yellow Enzyme family) [Galbitalea soli]
MATPKLFTPFTLRDLTVRNRIWVAPMCQYSVFERDGVPRDWHLAHLASFAAGGAGMIITEATAVSPEGRISDQDTGIWNQEQVVAWRRINDFLHAQGAKVGIQLAHAGRKASTWPAWGFDRSGTMSIADGGWATVAPSAVAFGHYDTPVALDADGIEKVVSDFVTAADRAVQAGFDLLELHAAHGYLLHQFLSPLSNQRDDEYGGSLENRARLLLRIVRAVRDAVGTGIPVLVRFSATDWTAGGWTQEETATVAGWAHEAGADFFDISTGGNVPAASIPIGPGYQVPFADYVGTEAEVPTGAVGLITEPAQAAEIVESGKADVVLLAREMLRDPHFALRAAHELGVEIDYWPGQYERARLA